VEGGSRVVGGACVVGGMGGGEGREKRRRLHPWTPRECLRLRALEI